jgi:hypothetical protein
MALGRQGASRRATRPPPPRMPLVLSRDDAQELLWYLAAEARRDGQVHPAEQERLVHLARALGVPEEELAGLLAEAAAEG